MPARTKPASALDLVSDIPKIFDQAQVTTANHQKNYVALHKLQCEAALQVEQDKKQVKLIGERAFEDAFLQMVARFLPVKKGPSQVDRVVKFIGGYIKFVNEKAVEEAAKNENAADDDDDDTTASRFTARLLRFLLKGFLAKDKAVRYRVVQLVSELVSYLGAIDEDLFMLLRSSLLDRINDKEPAIRVQAVIALSKLSNSEDPNDVADGELAIIEVLMTALVHDPAVDVRRTALLNIPLTPVTLAAVLTRTRDTDTNIRKLVYSSVLAPNDDHNAHPIRHPRTLTVAQRELVVRNGLGDREPVVKTAASNLLVSWAEIICDREGIKNETNDQADTATAVDDVVAFLKMFDLLEGTVAEDALLSVFSSHVNLLERLKFGDTFWSELTPEKAFLARVFVDHCIATKEDARLESALPVVTALAFKIQAAYNELLEDIQEADERSVLGGESVDSSEDDRMDKEFVIGEMLKLAVNLDYADEIGRRKMFQLVRDMISQDMLPENLVARCLDVLRTLSANERDLIRVVVEVIHDLRDPTDPEDDAPRPDETDISNDDTQTAARIDRSLPKPMQERTPEERARADAIDLRCLSLCIGMLERVHGTFEENSTLEGILGELILPAVKSKELALREKGLISLGLCCLIAKRMALASFQLFLAQVHSAPEILKLRVLQVVFDILMVHESEFLGKGGDHAENILKFVLNILANEESEKTQALLCIGLSKLMLAGIVSDDRVLTNLAMAYLSSSSAHNNELRQALSYFFPVYCYSSCVNQRRMQKIFIPTFIKFAEMHKELEDSDEMVSLAQVGGMFVDWTDPQKAIDVQGQQRDDLIHFDMAGDIVKALYNKELEKEDKKVLCQLLGKLHVPDSVDDDKLRTLKVLVHGLQSRRPLHDTTATNALTKFEAAITKKFEKQLQDFSEEQYRKLEDLQDLFEFLDDIIPEEDEDEVPKKKSMPRKRRSESVVSTTTDADRSTSVVSGRSSKSKAKRRRLSTPDDESGYESHGTERGATPSRSAPTRALPKRSAATKKAIVDLADPDEIDDDESTPEPVPTNAGSKYRRSKKDLEEEARLDAEIDDLLSGDLTEGDSSEDEEDEVQDLLSDI